jgi:hypothetical protein
MRQFFSIGLLLLTVIVLGGCSAGQPNIRVELDQYDFGVVQQGKVVATEISVHNAGSGELVIETVSTSCGCTSAQVDPLKIPAGSTGRLTIRYDSSVHPDSGPIQRYVYIVTNDPDEPEVEVLIKADVQAPTS